MQIISNVFFFVALQKPGLHHIHPHSHPHAQNEAPSGVVVGTSRGISPFQPIVRCKSSVNVPKTIDQCIKLAKSRPRPSSIRPFNKSRKAAANDLVAKRSSSSSFSSNNKRTGNCISSKNARTNSTSTLISSSTSHFESMNTPAKTVEVVLGTDASLSFDLGVDKLIKTFDSYSHETTTPTQLSKSCNRGEDAFVSSQGNGGLELGDVNIVDDNNDEDADFDEVSENINKLMDTISLLSCSSSLIENDEINYDDSLQDNSFDSDR